MLSYPYGICSVYNYILSYKVGDLFGEAVKDFRCNLMRHELINIIDVLRSLTVIDVEELSECG